MNIDKFKDKMQDKNVNVISHEKLSTDVTKIIKYLKDKDKEENISLIATEELSELIKSVTKWCRGYQTEDNRLATIEEFADVLIVMEMIKQYVGITAEEIEKAVAVKHERNMNKVKDGTYK